MLRALGWYQQYRALRPPACRYLPTCTAYSIEAVQTHGVARGLWLTLGRVGRCHPFGGHGHDPVPAAGRRSTPPPSPFSCSEQPESVPPPPMRIHNA